MGFVRSSEEVARIQHTLSHPRFVGAEMLSVDFLSTPEFVQSKDWLVRLNEYRAAVRLQKVQEDSEWSEAAADHARYLIETYAVMLNAGHHMTLEEMHHENPTSPWYSPHAAIAPPYSVIERMLASVVEPTLSIPPAHRSFASGLAGPDSSARSITW